MTYDVGNTGSDLGHPLNVSKKISKRDYYHPLPSR